MAVLLGHIALLCREHPQCLLHLCHAVALGLGLRLGALQGLFQIRDLLLLLLHLRVQQRRLFFTGQGDLGQAFKLLHRFFFALRPLRALLLQGGQTLFHPLASLDHKADFRFQAADFGTGFVQQALNLIDLIAGSVVRLAHGLQIGFDAAQVRHARLQCQNRALRIRLHLGLVGQRFGTLEVPLLVLLEGDVGLQTLVAQGHFGLEFEFFEIGVQLPQDVFYPCQVGPRVAQAVFGFAAALFVFRDTGRFFQEQPQLFRLGLDDAADRALADDGVGARAQTGAQKHVLHITAAHSLVVDEIARCAIAGQHPAHRDFAKLTPLASGAVVSIVKHQLHAGTAGRFAVGRPIENNVLHGLATQLTGAAFAQHPTHGVHDVGFAATIGPHHPHQLAGQKEVGWFDKGLEAR